MIVVRIERRIFGGKRANAPAAPHVRRHQALHYLRRAFPRHDAGPQAMPGVRSDGQHFLLVAVQGKRIKAELLIPESLVEMLKQFRRFRAQFAGAVGLAEGLEYLRHALPGVIDITLQFAQRFRSFHQRAIRIDDAVS